MEIEKRVIDMSAFEVRANEGEPLRIEGHAAVFNKWSQDLGGFTERIRPGAFAKAIKESDVRALFNHDHNYVLGRNIAGTLELREDGKGLLMSVTPPEEAQWVRDLMVSIKRGDITQQSFGFTVEKDEWKEDKEGAVTRTIHEINRLMDVSIVTFPAYPQTDAAVRSMKIWKQEQQPPGAESSEEQDRVIKPMLRKRFLRSLLTIKQEIR